MLSWYPQQESNLYLALRRGLFYPLNYEDRKIARSFARQSLL